MIINEMVILGHISALRYWKLVQIDQRCRSGVTSTKRMIERISNQVMDNNNALDELEKPIHTVTTRSAFRHPTKSMVCHVQNGVMPKGSFVALRKGLSVSSPELCFVQAASMVGLLDLIKLGFELCGSYAVLEGELISVTPLTTVSRLRSHVSKIENITGLKKARRALSYIIENSASPMETALAMILCLPYKLGGYGLDRPLLNHPIEPRRDSTMTKRYVCDLLWSMSHIAAEYDSDMFHSGENRINRDSIRRSDLALRGITVISVTRQQIMNSGEMEKVAQLLARKTGKRIRYKEPSFSHAHATLRKTLFYS